MFVSCNVVLGDKHNSNYSHLLIVCSEHQLVIHNTLNQKAVRKHGKYLRPKQLCMFDCHHHSEKQRQNPSI